MYEYRGCKIELIRYDYVTNKFIGDSYKPYFLTWSAKTSDEFIAAFHQVVDKHIEQEEINRCQNFADDLLNLCKKYEVELSVDGDYCLVANKLYIYRQLDNNEIDRCNSINTKDTKLIIK